MTPNDQDFLVRERHGFARLEGRERRREAGDTARGDEDDIDIGTRGHLLHRLPRLDADVGGEA
jgi:hypothetical protein